MQTLTKWTLGSLLVCSSVLAASQTQPVTQWVDKEIAAADKPVPEPHAGLTQYSIEDLKADVAVTHFDMQDRMHALRMQRILHYINEAQAFEQEQWQGDRNDAIKRASNILRHHQVKTGQVNVI